MEEAVLVDLESTGLEVIDVRDDAIFAARRLHHRDTSQQMEGLRRLSQAFVERPETIWQELVNTAVALCGADSAGISMEQDGSGETDAYRWIATAGDYAGFQDAVLPRNPSACGLCLERGRPQLFRVRQQFFDLMGIQAAVVTDGLLLPWEVDDARGTIWVMAHGREEAFDASDLGLMQVLADFAAMAMRQQRQRAVYLAKERLAAATEMANHLAHAINNPLQSLTNLVFLAETGASGPEGLSLAKALADDLSRLSYLVGELLTLKPRTV